MKWLIGAACVTVIAAGGFYLASEYLAYRSQRIAADAFAVADEAIIAQKIAFDRKLQEVSDNSRMSVIGQSGCNQAAIDIVWLTGMKPIRSVDDVSPQMAQDIRICLFRNMISAADIQKIRSAGVYSIFAS
jgi:hypothetical protein